MTKREQLAHIEAAFEAENSADPAKHDARRAAWDEYETGRPSAWWLPVWLLAFPLMALAATTAGLVRLLSWPIRRWRRSV